MNRLTPCLSELVHITTEPALQRDCPPVQIGPGALTARGRRANAQEERGGSENGLPPGRPCLLHYLEFSPFALAWLAWKLPGYDPHEVWMSLALRGRITPDHARRIRAALTRTGWMGEDGLPIHRDDPELARQPGEDVDAVHAFHMSGLALTRTDLRLPGALPRLRGLVLALPSDDFGRAREALQGCRSEILEALRGAEQRARAGLGHLDRVISAQLQLFPLTVPLKRR